MSAIPEPAVLMSLLPREAKARSISTGAFDTMKLALQRTERPSQRKRCVRSDCGEHARREERGGSWTATRLERRGRQARRRGKRSQSSEHGTAGLTHL